MQPDHGQTLPPRQFPGWLLALLLAFVVVLVVLIAGGLLLSTGLDTVQGLPQPTVTSEVPTNHDDIYVSTQAGEQDRLIKFIESKGGRVTAQNVQQGVRQFRTNSDVAKKALNALVAEGRGGWTSEQSRNGGPPKRVFTLFVYGTPLNPGEKGSSVDVDGSGQQRRPA